MIVIVTPWHYPPPAVPNRGLAVRMRLSDRTPKVTHMPAVITCLCIACLERNGMAFATAQSLLCLECEAHYVVCLDCDEIFILAESTSAICCADCLQRQATPTRLAA
jgi:hypothetical protein